MECPSENSIAVFLEEGSSPRTAEIEQHFEHCAACRSLVWGPTAGHALSAVAPDAETVRRTASPETPPDALAAGTRVGRYVVERPIGRGGMGIVFAAHDPDLNRPVALKLLRAELSRSGANEALRHRLLREAQAMARLSHPNVVTVHDVGLVGDQLFIAMERVDGGTLRQWVRGERRSWREVVSIFLEAGAGLLHAHKAGIVHRDFKPDNVLVDADGRPHVTDFGLARALLGDAPVGGESVIGAERAYGAPPESNDVSLTHTGVLVGTPAYMSPEQLAGRAVDARSDIFAFCVSLYEALYGERPFAGVTVGELESNISSSRIRPAPRKVMAPTWLRRAIVRGLSPSPDRRYGTMEELLSALARPPLMRGAVSVALAGAAVAAVLAGGASRHQNRVPPPAHVSTAPAPSDLAPSVAPAQLGPPPPAPFAPVPRAAAPVAPKRHAPPPAPSVVPPSDRGAAVHAYDPLSDQK